jgi:hypothetical protein
VAVAHRARSRRRRGARRIGLANLPTRSRTRTRSTARARAVANSRAINSVARGLVDGDHPWAAGAAVASAHASPAAAASPLTPEPSEG